jgi:hypothetical protein
MPGGVPEWSKGADCKSVGYAYGGSSPPLPTMREKIFAGVAQLARASAFQAEGRGFESRLPLQRIVSMVSIDATAETILWPT